jgi:plasmid maintenance system antidote protein VapI
VTADTALRLARFFNTSAEFWMNLQAMHDLTKARRESGKAIERDIRPRPPDRFRQPHIAISSAMSRFGAEWVIQPDDA